MRALLFLLITSSSAFAQSPAVQLINTTRPSSSDFQIGDGFKIVVNGPPNQPVSVRTTTQVRTDWGPVIGWTDLGGRWSTAGQFKKEDFGGWGEFWTVGNKLADPAVHFEVTAPCLKGGQGLVFMSGPNLLMHCDTAEGPQSFGIPSQTDPFRTPDGRLISPSARPQTSEQYHAEIMEYLIGSRANRPASGRHGDEAGALILKIIGVNALTEDEAENVLSIVRTAFDKPEKTGRNTAETLHLLRNLAESSSRESLKQKIAETIEYVQSR